MDLVVSFFGDIISWLRSTLKLITGKLSDKKTENKTNR